MTNTEFDIPGANSEIGRLAFMPAFLIYGALVGLIGGRLLHRQALASMPSGRG